MLYMLARRFNRFALKRKLMAGANAMGFRRVLLFPCPKCGGSRVHGMGIMSLSLGGNGAGRT
jgi:hypothetical protein